MGVYDLEWKIKWEELAPSLQKKFTDEVNARIAGEKEIWGNDALYADSSAKKVKNIYQIWQALSRIWGSSGEVTAHDITNTWKELDKVWGTDGSLSIHDLTKVWKELSDMHDDITDLAKMIDYTNGASFKSWNLKMWNSHHIFRDLSFYEEMRVTQSGVRNKITDKTANNIMNNIYSYPTLNSQAMWLKHQLAWTAPGDISRLYIGGRAADGTGTCVYRSDATGLTFTKVASLSGYAIWDMVSFTNSSGQNAMYMNAWLGSGSYIYKTTDGLNYTKVASIGATYAKTLCVFNDLLMCVTPGTTYYTSDGTTWSSASNNLSCSQIYSRYCTENAMYIGTAGSSAVYTSSDGFNFTRLWLGDGSYTRWICAWTPKNNKDHGKDVEYIVWGTGGSGTEVGTAMLMMYDPVDAQVYCLFDFRNGDGTGDGTQKYTNLNYGHAPLEPLVVTSSGTYKTSGFRERQIRYIEVYTNDYTGESFLVIGTSDCHFYTELNGTTLYYSNCDTSNLQPLTDSDTGGLLTWTDDDKKAWASDNVVSASNVSQPTYMGNIYVVSPRNASAFKKDDLIIALIKHTEDTRVYSMGTFTDTDNVKWVYAGTGGGNYNGKGLLYRFGYSDMLDLVEAAKIYAILPPRWSIEGKVNQRIRQDGTRFYLKAMTGNSARESYSDVRFAFNRTFGRSTTQDPYFKLISNQYDTANSYIMKFYPVGTSSNSSPKVECIIKLNNVEKVVYTKTFSSLSLYSVDETTEAQYAPNMGPFYHMAIVVKAGQVNPNATTSLDTYLYDSLDGTIAFLFKIGTNRDELLTESDNIYTYTINYSGGERKNIGIYGIETFDCPGLYLLSMKQQSLAKYELDAKNQSLEGSGEIVFSSN